MKRSVVRNISRLKIPAMIAVILMILTSGNELISQRNAAVEGMEENNPEKSLSPYFFIETDDPSVDQMPLLSASADVVIAGVIADVTIKQVYKNEGTKPLEAIYIFPASTRAAVYAMSMKIGDRLLEAEIKEKEEARKEYEKAKQEGRSASLLEQERPNVFKMNVANIMPGDRIEVTMKYTELLVPEDGIYKFIYPTVVGPRYSRRTENEGNKDDFVETPYLKEGKKPEYEFDLDILLKTGVPLQDIECPTHSVNVERTSENTAAINLDDSEKNAGNKDFILEYTLAGKKIETGLLISESKDENFFLLMLQPPKRVEQQQIAKREYVFVVDVSGSMNGFPLNISKKMMRNLLGDLRPDEKFNIVMFAAGSELFSEQSVPANMQNIEKGIEFLSKAQGGGGTELIAALQRTLKLPKAEGYSRSFVILTDGYVDVEQETYDLIRENLDNSNFFTFGIGTSVNRYIIEGMANVGYGESFVVLSRDEAEEKAEKFREYISSPVMTNIRVEFDGFGAYDTEPQRIPDLFASRPIIIQGKWNKPMKGSIRVYGNAGGQVLKTEIPVTKYETHDNSQALKYLWARKKLQRISDYAGLSFRNNMKDEITQLGLKYNLMTQYTSFVAVDYKIRNENGELVKVKQPNPLPEGVSDKAIGGSSISQTRADGMDVGHGFHGGGSAAKSMVSPLSIRGSRNNESMADIAVVEEEPAELKDSAEYPGPDEFIPVEKQPTVDLEKLQKKIKYPEKARKAGIEGRVIVKALIDKKGKVQRKIIQYSDNEILNEAALEAVEDTKFEPATQKGKPIASWVSLPIQFRLRSDQKETEIPFGKYDNFTEIKDGLLYWDKKEGTGITAINGLHASIEYEAYREDGTLIESTGHQKSMFTFRIGQNKVIEGLDKGILGMRIGGKRVLVIPPEMQRGMRPTFRVPDGENLIMLITLEDLR